MTARNENMITQVDLRENAVYVVKDGHCTKLLPMKSGQDEVVWKDGIVLDVVRSQRIRLGRTKEIGTNE